VATLDFVLDPADASHIQHLVHRAGETDIGPERIAKQRRSDRDRPRQTGARSIHAYPGIERRRGWQRELHVEIPWIVPGSDRGRVHRAT
jgi:hypothetical protein